MERGFELDRAQLRAPPDGGKQFASGLDKPLGPARLLRLEGVHLDRQLRRALDARVIDELPAPELGAITQVSIFGEGVVLPAAGVLDRGSAPHAGGAVEVEEAPGKVSGAVLDHEMAVEQNGLDFRQVRVMAIEPGPAALDHRHLGVGEVVDHLADDRRGRNKVGVKDGDELARRGLQPFRQRSGLEPFSVTAVVVGDGVAGPGVFTDEARADDLRLVVRIVEHLDFQELPRVVDVGGGLEQPLDHVALVIHRQLDGDARQALESLPRLGELATVLEV